jgi:hypothetical protein
VDSTVQGTSSTVNSAPSAEAALENATQADLGTNGSGTSASARHDGKAKGGVDGQRLDLEADASASSSAEASVDTPR